MQKLYLFWLVIVKKDTFKLNRRRPHRICLYSTLSLFTLHLRGISLSLMCIYDIDATWCKWILYIDLCKGTPTNHEEYIYKTKYIWSKNQPVRPVSLAGWLDECVWSGPLMICSLAWLCCLSASTHTETQITTADHTPLNRHAEQRYYMPCLALPCSFVVMRFSQSRQ